MELLNLPLQRQEEGIRFVVEVSTSLTIGNKTLHDSSTNPRYLCFGAGSKQMGSNLRVDRKHTRRRHNQRQIGYRLKVPEGCDELI